METWKEKNPTWEHKLWTEQNLPQMKCQAQFDAMKDLPGKADILRYEILFSEGGFYIDADTECVNPLDDFFVNNDSFACWENETTRAGLVTNAFLGTTKNNVLMESLLNTISAMKPRYVEFLPLGNSCHFVGPELLTRTIRNFRYKDIQIYPSWYFIPQHYSGDNYTGNDKVYAKHQFKSTSKSKHRYLET
jgi:mannosyltransferase OCH1-like enzyme